LKENYNSKNFLIDTASLLIKMKKREPKVYSSFDEFKRATSGWQDYYPYRKPSHIYFSKTEILHIILALAVLTFAFSFALFRPLSFANISKALPISFLGIGMGFLLHELGHKFTAQHFGLWAEFRAFPQGLIFALLLSLLAGVVFAAPGAVYIGGGSKRESGIISLAGPLTNIGIALVALPFWILNLGSFAIAKIAYFIFLINSFLALFNMLPFGPLDGRKVFRWNYLAFGLTIGIAFLMVLFAEAPQIFLR
jgi:Zn-dependent protease